MKLLIIIAGISLLLSPLDGPKKSNAIKNKICKTWVAYEVITSEPMMHREYTRKVDKHSYDSIQINKDGSYYRYFHKTSFNGNWKMNADSTGLFILPNPPTHANSGWIITELSDSSFYLKQFAGREGESKTYKYKPVAGAKN